MAMHPLPRSLAARLGWVLTAGLVASVFATLAVSRWDPASRLLERISTLVIVADRASVAERRALLPRLGEPGLQLAWSPAAERASLEPGVLGHHLAHDLRATLRGSGLERIEAGREARDVRRASLRPHAGADTVHIHVGLSDGSALDVRVAAERLAGFGAIDVALGTLVLAGSIVALAVWAARRVTRPLRRFADAAGHFGLDTGAMPLSETGPVEIRRAAAAFNRMQRRVARLMEDRRLLVGALSHDSRTVLARLRLRSEYIGDSHQRAKAIRDIDELTFMLGSALAFARDDLASEPAVSLDLALLLQSVCDDLADAGERVIFEGPAHLRFSGRPVALRRLFANLLDNAIAYGEEATVVLTSLVDGVEIIVGDRGPGIPPEDCERVFAPFHRLDPSRSRETGGSGLGLAIVRAVAHRHGGSVRLEPRPGGGTLARVELPVPTRLPPGHEPGRKRWRRIVARF